MISKRTSLLDFIKKIYNKYPLIFTMFIVIVMLKLMIWHSSYINFEWNCKINGWEFNKNIRLCYFDEKTFDNLKDFSDYNMKKYWMMNIYVKNYDKNN